MRGPYQWSNRRLENPASAFRNLGDSPIIKCIGNTPLLEIKLFESEFPEVEVYAKAEWFNPGGSVKDRPALFMVKDGLESGELRPGKILLDSTSGNTGIAYAMIGRRARDSRPPRPACERER